MSFKPSHPGLHSETRSPCRPFSPPLPKKKKSPKRMRQNHMPGGKGELFPYGRYFLPFCCQVDCLSFAVLCVVKDEKDEWEEMTRGEISQHGRVCCTSVCLQQGARRHYSPGLSAGHLGRSGVSQISVNATFRTLATHCPFPNSML